MADASERGQTPPEMGRAGDGRKVDGRSGGGRNRVAEALTRVVARDGIAGVSVRSVATEAGVTGGTVQHHFATRAEMIRYAMEWTSLRVEQRLSTVPHWGEVSGWTRDLLLELLPLDDERRREHAVWLAFVAHASTDPTLTELKRRTNGQLRALYQRIVAGRRGLPDPTESSGSIESTDPPVPNPDLASDAALLQALMDGLSLQLADLEPAEARRLGPELLDRYLALGVHRSDPVD
ncbi:TetR/AcrR family transcriptional regulator [Propionibacteriaceae bacterium Y1685]|uniref:TetR/AcrR family transcriptional regulator n=1 Tax=Microlunatus sp. Y1700 TaxID=3418487 RepID=UPI003B767C89